MTPLFNLLLVLAASSSVIGMYLKSKHEQIVIVLAFFNFCNCLNFLQLIQLLKKYNIPWYRRLTQP